MSQPHPAPTAQARRDVMFCHECEDEWFRDEHGLTCPECGSDFTEIIEDDHDPRDTMHEDDGYGLFPPQVNMGMPPMRSMHDPDSNMTDDPDETDISNFHFAHVGPGRFNVQATITRNVSPNDIHSGNAPASIAGFMSMINGLTRAAAAGQGQGENQGQNQEQAPGNRQGDGLFSRAGEQPQGHEHEHSEDSTEPQMRTGRFTYQGGARLFPRTDGPGMRIEPVDDISNVMAGLMAAIGAPQMQGSPHFNGPGHMHQHNANEGADPNQPGGHQGQAVSPFFGLLQTMGIIPAGGNMGDFVTSQEGLDRIVSQLMEQTATSNAPGPAPEDEINALPRKKVSEDMLGPEHRAECSICMDEVAVGEQVTELPCRHWFHHQCVSAWLLEHNTCPHCRKGISRDQNEATPASVSSDQAQASAGAQTTGSRTMPGSFETESDADVAGTGTPHDPYVVQSSTGASAGSRQGGATDAADTPDGGVADRVRRGLFWP